MVPRWRRRGARPLTLGPHRRSLHRPRVLGRLGVPGVIRRRRSSRGRALSRTAGYCGRDPLVDPARGCRRRGAGDRPSYANRRVLRRRPAATCLGASGRAPLPRGRRLRLAAVRRARPRSLGVVAGAGARDGDPGPLPGRRAGSGPGFRRPLAVQRALRGCCGAPPPCGCRAWRASAWAALAAFACRLCPRSWRPSSCRRASWRRSCWRGPWCPSTSRAAPSCRWWPRPFVPRHAGARPRRRSTRRGRQPLGGRADARPGAFRPWRLAGGAARPWTSRCRCGRSASCGAGGPLRPLLARLSGHPRVDVLCRHIARFSQVKKCKESRVPLRLRHRVC